MSKISLNTKTINSLNFGFIAWLVAIKGYKLIKIDKKDGAFINMPENVYLKDLKDEYNSSKFKIYNDTLREVINKFKNS